MAAMATVEVKIADLPELLALLRSVEELVDDLTDPDECVIDHDGDCQAHDWFGAGVVGRSCPHARAKDFLSRMAQTTDGS